MNPKVRAIYYLYFKEYIPYSDTEAFNQVDYYTLMHSFKDIARLILEDLKEEKSNEAG